MQKKLLKLIIVVAFLFFHLTVVSAGPEEKTDDPQPPKETTEEKEKIPTVEMNEQISCGEENCIRIESSNPDEVEDKLYESINNNAGKILIDYRKQKVKLSDDSMEKVLEYLKQLSKREGKISIEPYYMGIRSIEDVPGFGVFKDTLLLGWNIYKRIKNAIKFRNLQYYHAKVLYHPANHRIMIIFFVQRNYGDVCSTIYAKCNEVEYLDDDSFDLSLSTALKESLETKQAVRVNFRQQKAILPSGELTLENIKNINNSTRIYKWMVVSGKTEKRSTKKERFIPFQTVLTAIDYSIKLYDSIQAAIMYKPAAKMQAVVNYSGQERGGIIQNIVFTPLEDEATHEKK